MHKNEDHFVFFLYVIPYFLGLKMAISVLKKSGKSLEFQYSKNVGTLDSPELRSTKDFSTIVTYQYLEVLTSLLAVLSSLRNYLLISEELLMSYKKIL